MIEDIIKSIIGGVIDSLLLSWYYDKKSKKNNLDASIGQESYKEWSPEKLNKVKQFIKNKRKSNESESK